MSRFGFRALLTAALVALSVAIAGGVVAATQSSDEQALEPTRGPADRGREAREQPPRAHDARGEAPADPAALGQPGHGRGRGRAGPQRRRSSASPIPSGSTTAALAVDESRLRHPDPVRLRHDPRLPHDLPDPARRGQQLRPGCRHRRPPDRRPRIGRRRPQADLQPDGRRLARAALGPDRRGRGRGPLSELGASPPRASKLRRARTTAARQGRDERQAPGRLRPARGRAGLQHDRHVRAAAAQPVPAAVQGRDRRRRRHGDVLVQRDQRRARAAPTPTSRRTS